MRTLPETTLTSWQRYLRERSIPYTLQPRLVRGLDYYTRTAFEFVHGSLGAQNSLLGGGRYDGLSKIWAVRPRPASASPSERIV